MAARANAAKSRNEKGASRGGTQSVSAPIISTDIIPGKMTNADWDGMMNEENDSHIVGSIVDDILQETLDKCYESYIWQQVLPYTAIQTKNTLLQIVEWHFLSRDFGEQDITRDGGWTEESEPEPTMIDSWAQGSVPVVVRTQSTTVSATSDDMPMSGRRIPDKELAPSNTIISESYMSETEGTVTGTVEPINEEPEEDNMSEVTKSPEPPAPVESPKKGKKKSSYKKYLGAVPKPAPIEEDAPKSTSSPKQTSPTSNTIAKLTSSQKSLLKLQAGRPPGNREVTFDDHGNVVGVMKLNSRNLPKHRVRVIYNVVDPKDEAISLKSAALRGGKISMLRNSKINKYTEPVPPISPKAGKHIARLGTGKSIKINALFPRDGKRHAKIDPVPPTMLETIDASPGVQVFEGGMTKVGPEGSAPYGYTQKLFPRNLISNNGITTSMRLLGSTMMPLATDGGADQQITFPTIHPQDLLDPRMLATST